jgi:hypothetical protein
MIADERKVTRAVWIGEGPRRVCGIVFAALMWVVAALHVYYALGGLWGISVAGGGALGAGDTLSTGMRAAAAGLALALVAASVLALMRVGVIRGFLPSRLTAVGCWVVAAVMLAVAVGNFTDGERWGLLGRGPFSLLLCILMLVVALPSRGPARSGGS